MKFWAEVLNFKDTAGNNPYINIAKFAIQLLTLPWSNAEVERVFSQVNLVKTKIRSCLQSETLNDILSIR